MSETELESRIGFTSELGLTVRADGDAHEGRAIAASDLCIPGAGVLRPSVLLTWADILTGSLANEHTLPQVCMTVDLSVRIARPIAAGAEVHGRGVLLKVGRTLTFAETTFTVGGDPSTVAIASSTFVASPRPQDVGVSALPATSTLSAPAAALASTSVSEMLGTERVEHGVVEVPRHPRLLNWADTVQGGAVAACAEEAVLSLEPPPVPTELEVRYTGAVRVGPMRATARRFGAWVRIAVVDAGNAERLAAVAAARG